MTSVGSLHDKNNGVIHYCHNLFCFSLKLTSNLLTNGYTDIQDSRAPLGQNQGDMNFPLTEDFPIIHDYLYTVTSDTHLYGV